MAKFIATIVCIGFGLGDKFDLIKDRIPFKAVYSVDENLNNGVNNETIK